MSTTRALAASIARPTKHLHLRQRLLVSTTMTSTLTTGLQRISRTKASRRLAKRYVYKGDHFLRTCPNFGYYCAATSSRLFASTTASATSFSTTTTRLATRHLSTALTASDEEDETNGDTNGSGTSVVPFLLADIGEGIQEVEVLQWFVKVGDHVKEFDTICQVQTDKATVEITSRFAGRIVEISKKSKISVGQPLVHIETIMSSSTNDKKAAVIPPMTANSPASAAATPPPAAKASRKPTADTRDAKSSSTVIPFLLADIGEGIQEVEVLQWYVQVGDQVQMFDTICQVQSDKATVDITSRYSGKIVEVSPKSKIAVGQPLVHIQTATPLSSASAVVSGGDSSNTLTALEQEHQQDRVELNEDSRLYIPSVASRYALDSDAPELSNDVSSTKYLASPAVRKLAADHHLNVRAIPGSGPHGRVLKADILQFVKQQQGRGAPPLIPSAKPTGPAMPSPTTTVPVQHPNTASVDESLSQNRIVTMKGYNKFMVQSMTESLKIPQMALGDEIIVDKLIQFRQDWNAGGGVTLGIQTFLIKACSLALKEYPQVNAKAHNVEECQICCHANHDIGVAMDTPHGLVVPVIRNVQNLSLVEIQHEVDRLKEAAASGTISLQDLSPGPTFTLSNIGAIGVGTNMSPVLVPPMIAMGALGRIQRLPRFDENDQVVPVHVLYASWCADHRFLDGATLARFHKSFSNFASDPLRMLPHLK